MKHNKHQIHTLNPNLVARHPRCHKTDVIKYMLRNPIMSGRVDKWAYALVEYDLAYAPLKSMKGQIVTDFIVEHRI